MACMEHPALWQIGEMVRHNPFGNLRSQHVLLLWREVGHHATPHSLHLLRGKHILADSAALPCDCVHLSRHSPDCPYFALPTVARQLDWHTITFSGHDRHICRRQHKVQQQGKGRIEPDHTKEVEKDLQDGDVERFAPRLPQSQGRLGTVGGPHQCRECRHHPHSRRHHRQQHTSDRGRPDGCGTETPQRTHLCMSRQP